MGVSIRQSKHFYRTQTEQQLVGLHESVIYFLRIMDEEIRLLNGNAEKILLAGIGQGMALGFVALLCTQRKLGSFIGVNGWIPFSRTLTAFLKKGRID